MDTLLTKEQKLAVLTTLGASYSAERDAASKAVVECTLTTEFMRRVAAAAEARTKIESDRLNSIESMLAEFDEMAEEVNAGKL